MAVENQQAPEAPQTEEDRFAAAVAERDAAREREASKPEDAEPRQPEAPREERSGDPAAGAGRARGADGKFLPAGATGAEAEPFAGYKDLPEAQRRAVDELLSRERRATSRAAAAQRDLEASRRRTPQNQRPPTPARTAQPPAQPQQPRKLPKWDAAVTGEYRETFETIQERIAAGESELGRQLTATEKRLAEVEQKLQEVGGVAARVSQREDRERRVESKRILSDLSPNFEVTAGWKDAQGREIPEAEQVFAPEFDAWLNALPPTVKARREEELASTDPYIIGSVFQQFDRDYAEAMGWQTNHGTGNGANATPRNPVAERRAAAQNDIQRRPGGASPRRDAPAQPQSRWEQEEAAFAASVTPENRKQWRGLRG